MTPGEEHVADLRLPVITGIVGNPAVDPAHLVTDVNNGECIVTSQIKMIWISSSRISTLRCADTDIADPGT